MEKVYLLECIYESEKQRVVSNFSKDPYSQKTDFIIKEKFTPYLFVDIPKEFAKKLLSDFRKEIKIENYKNNLKITAKDKETLDKIYKIISLSTSKNILLLDAERQYLIEKDWGYYDLFIVVSRNRVKKIENNNIGSVVRKYINPFLKEEQIMLIEKLTRKVLLSNILKKKVDRDIRKDQIMNAYFENMFFKNGITIENNYKIEVLKKKRNLKEGIQIDFSNIWPYLLTKEFYNIGNETINCTCCKPRKYLDINVLSSSKVKVKFLKNGFYFLTKNKEWANTFHKNKDNKENRLSFMKNNGLKEIPIGPFYNNNNKEEILLVDAFKLLENKEIEMVDENKLNWFCLKEESYISRSIKENLKKLKDIEKSINLSTSITYNNSFKNSLEKSPLFIQYLTEYKLINDLIQEIPNFLEHKNTKFYNPLIAESIKHIKLETVQKIDINNNKYFIENEKVIVRENSFIEKVNNYFPEINLPVPKLIVG